MEVTIMMLFAKQKNAIADPTSVSISVIVF